MKKMYFAEKVRSRLERNESEWEAMGSQWTEAVTYTSIATTAHQMSLAVLGMDLQSAGASRPLIPKPLTGHHARKREESGFACVRPARATHESNTRACTKEGFWPVCGGTNCG